MTQCFGLLGLSGSPCRGSNSTTVLRGLQDALAPRVALDIYLLSGTPLYNADDDGVIMISPEYNHGMSGVLKNALDRASRPHGRSALKGMPVLTMTASPAFAGGVRLRQQMNETIASIPARLVFRPQIAIGGVDEKVRDGHLVDETSLRFALAGIDDLLDEIRAAWPLGPAA